MTDAERRYADLQGAYEATVALARFLRDTMERAGPADEEAAQVTPPGQTAWP